MSFMLSLMVDKVIGSRLYLTADSGLVSIIITIIICSVILIEVGVNIRITVGLWSVVDGDGSHSEPDSDGAVLAI